VQVGELVADKYRVEEIIAAGGMGVVVGAQHVQLGQRFAIKFLLSDAEHEAAVERFLREARAAARIDSSHVCRVFDCGTLPDGTPYMVMEHLVGHDLGQELKNRGPLPVSEAADLILQAIEGIAEAHAVGVVHRDLKPTNLFLYQKSGRPREVKVLDFGISKLAATEENVEEDLTSTSTMLGSPRYMSPEQVQNAKNVDARTDIWSLGVILYQLLDGATPFAGATMGETLGKVLLHAPPSIRSRRSDVPEGLASVVERCLMRDRERRYRNVAELALSLAPFGSAASQPSVQRITALLVDGQLGLATQPEAVAQRDSVTDELTRPLARAKLSEEPSQGTVGGLTSSELDFRPRRRGLFIGAGVALVLGIAGTFLVLRPASPVAPGSSSAAKTPAPPAEPAPAAIAAPSALPSEPASAASEPAPAPNPSALPSANAQPSASAGAAGKARVSPPGAKPGKKDLLDDSY